MSGLYSGWGSTCHPYFPKFPILHLKHEAALYRAWLQSVSSSISRLRFAEQGPRSLRYRTQCSLLKSGSQLLRKPERLHHPTGHSSAVCRTFEMTHVVTAVPSTAQELSGILCN
jgi:hypothetical protein